LFEIYVLLLAAAAAASAAACATELLQKAEGQKDTCTGTGQQNLISSIQ